RPSCLQRAWGEVRGATLSGQAGVSTILNPAHASSIPYDGEARMARKRRTPLRTSVEDIDAAKRAPETPQTRAPAFRLAFADDDFLTSEDLRGVRFQLEYLKPEFMLRERGINSTVVLFGGARIPAPGKPAWAARNEVQKTNLEAASRY